MSKKLYYCSVCKHESENKNEFTSCKTCESLLCAKCKSTNDHCKACETVKCPICGETKWTNVDKYRVKKAGMSICGKCGFVTYPSIVYLNKEYKDYYRDEYKSVPTINALFTGQRKLHYHAKFLNDLFIEWKKDNKKRTIVDVGCAIGMSLKWFKDIFPSYDINGTELMESARRIAFYEFGFKVSEEIDDSKKYDLIMNYKVIEHQPFPDKELIKYRNLLNDDGLLYISTPTWFNILENSGKPGFDIEFYYSVNHVNVWTEKNFEHLLAKCGFEIVKKDTACYGNTYLCKKSDEKLLELDTKDNCLQSLKNIKTAFDLTDAQDFKKILEAYPKFPFAWTGFYERNRNEFHKKGFESIENEVIKPALELMPTNVELINFCADLYFRYDYCDKALELCERSLYLRPENPPVYMMIASLYRRKSDLCAAHGDKEGQTQAIRESAEIIKHLRLISVQHRDDCFNWLFNDYSRLPL